MTSASRSAEGPVGVGAGATTGDRRVREAVVSGFAWTVSAAGLIWGTIYAVLGLPIASVYPYVFSVISLANVLAYRKHRRFKLFACLQMFAVLLAPAGLMIHLGGLVSSGVVGLWSLLAPIGALLVIGPRFALGVFAAFVAAISLGLWADDRLAAVEPLTGAALDGFLLLNTIGPSLVAFWAMRIFLTVNERLASEEQRLRQVERSYVAQEAMLRQQERLATLGKLSAGVAHELNNPAAAAGRATGHLESTVHRLPDRAMALMGLGVGSEGIEWLWSMADDVASVDALDVGDRADGLGSWFAARSVADSWDLAAGLAGLGFDVGVLNQATERFSERQVIAAMQWIADVEQARRLLGEVRTSTGRISQIVGALKGYSHMDGAARAAVDIPRGIQDTLIILRSQLTGITVEKHFPPDFPPVVANAGELNQVWTNLIANAAEALDGAGTIVIDGVHDEGTVMVGVADDGPGIPDLLIDSVFDPFITTKAPGKGTGLGLSLTQQIVVERHRGSIDVESRPGHTRFVVTLPVEGPTNG